MSERVLVTGASGYLGARCVAALVASGVGGVMALWRTNTTRLPRDLPGVAFAQCDLADGGAVQAVTRAWRPTAIVHAAALLPDGQPDYARRAIGVNVLGTANVLAAAQVAECSRIVYCSSISVYGSAACPKDGWNEDTAAAPSSVYGRSKYAAEEVLRLQDSGLVVLSLRLAGIHGGGRRGGALFHMIRAALGNQVVTVDYPAEPFQVVFVDDAAAAVVRASRAGLPAGHHPVNIASHVYPSMVDMAREIVSRCKSRSAIEVREAGARGAQVMSTARMRSLFGAMPGRPAERLDGMIRELAQDRVGAA